MLFFIAFYSSKNPEEAELEDILNSVVSDNLVLTNTALLY